MYHLCIRRQKKWCVDVMFEDGQITPANISAELLHCCARVTIYQLANMLVARVAYINQGL